MKKHLIAFLLAALILLTGCSEFLPQNQIENDSSVGSEVYTEAVTKPKGEMADPTKAHVDKDNDGLCDDCSGVVVTTCDFYAINDLHGKFKDTDAQPGVDELTTYIKSAYKTDDAAIFLSSGDMWQGSSESNLTKGMIVTEWMNEMDIVSMTMGNHEFDWGEEYIIKNEALANFPFLAINIFDKKTDKRVDYCDASVMVERNGIKIGIIGAIGDCYSSISGDKVKDVYFKTGYDLSNLVKEESKKLRDQGAKYIVYSIHDGSGRNHSGVHDVSSNEISNYYDMALSKGGYVDLVFEGHSHKSYVMKDRYGVYHLQGGGENKGISHVEVDINFANGNSDVNIAEFVSTSRYSSMEDDKIVEDLLEKYKDEVSIANKVLGQNDVPRDSSFLRQLVADLYFKAGIERWKDKYDIVLGGGYISVRSPYELHAGKIKYSDLQSLFPFDNRLVLCSIKGADLKYKFFESSNPNYFVSYDSYGESIRNNIDVDKTYYIVSDTYSSSYAPNHLTVVEEYEDNIFARDLLGIYIEKGGLSGNNPITPDNPETPPNNQDIKKVTIKEAIGIAESLKDNFCTNEEFLVEGKIIDIVQAFYGNMYIGDEEGNIIYVYGVSDRNGNKYGNMLNKPVIGDTIELRGQIKKYINKSGDTILEFQNTVLVSINKNVK